MPSPFPGMDPYLESSDIWPDLHVNLITSIQRQINSRLPPRYRAVAERRVYVIEEDDTAYRHLVPDVAIQATAARPPRPGGRLRAPNASPAVVAKAGPAEVQEPYLVIRGADDRDVVTVVEALSPTNKTAGSRGEREYRQKRSDVLASTSSLVEIDLLRGGVELPFRTRPGVRNRHYYVSVSVASSRSALEVYAWSVRDTLPAVSVPLRAPEPDVLLDLGTVIAEIYDANRYQQEIDYRVEPPPPPLAGNDAAWLDAVLRASGHRP